MGCILFPSHLRRIKQLVCDKMPRPGFTYPSWLPGFLSYCESRNRDVFSCFRPLGCHTNQNQLFPFLCSKVSLLVINALLPLIAIITLDNVATGPQLRLFPRMCFH